MLEREHQIAGRYAALAMIDAYAALGLTSTAAVVLTSQNFRIPKRTLWRWRAWVEGIAFVGVPSRVAALGRDLETANAR